MYKPDSADQSLGTSDFFLFPDTYWSGMLLMEKDRVPITLMTSS